MMKILRQSLSYVLPEHCINKYLDEYAFLDVPCFRITLSKALGYGVVAGSSMVKIPQVVKIIKNTSVAGISISSVLLELLSCTATSVYSLAHGFPFSSYGEGTFLGLQNFIIGFLAIAWTYSYTYSVLFGGLFFAMLALLMSPTVPMNVLVTLQTANVPIIISSKLLQIWVNYRNKSTGQLSGITLALFALGSTARIFTSIQDTGDGLLIASCLLASLCNYILVFQLLYYWNSFTDQKEQKSK